MCLGWVFFPFSVCRNVGSGGCATGVGQEGAGGDARLPKASSRGNSLERTGVLKLGEKEKKVAGGRTRLWF